MKARTAGFVFVVVLSTIVACGQRDSAGRQARRFEPALPATIIGSVRDTSGSTLSDVAVSVHRCSGAKPVDLEGMRAFTDASGRYTIRVAWSDAESITIHEVRGNHPGLVEACETGEWTLKTGDELTIDLVLREGERLAGLIRRPLTTMERHIGLSQDSMRYHFLLESESFARNFLTDEGGRFDFTVPPGTYTLRVPSSDILVENLRPPATDLVIEPRHSEVTPETLGDAFDALWENMDRHYSYFELKGVDWAALRSQERETIVKSESLPAFVDNLRAMLSRLEDMHVWLDTSGAIVNTYNQPFERNWHPPTILASLATQVDCDGFAKVGTTIDGFGVLIILRQEAATDENVEQTVRRLQELRHVPGFLVDLRGGCTGGDESLVRSVASFFCENDTLYARSRYRNGPGHDEFGPPRDRVLPAGARPFTKPVVCMIGGKCMSSGEAFVQMMSALPHVTTVGVRTRGASGNPKPIKLANLPVQVWYSRWVDLMPDGTPVEGAGIAPDITVDLPVCAYQNTDPTWRTALSILQEMIATTTAPRG